MMVMTMVLVVEIEHLTLQIIKFICIWNVFYLKIPWHLHGNFYPQTLSSKP
jgi:hypothetical protein